MGSAVMTGARMADRPLRILAVHRYYFPDTPPYATILRSIVKQWHQDGHDVDVLTSQPSYKKDTRVEARPRVEQMDGARVTRVRFWKEHGRPLVRILNMLRFMQAIVFHALKNGRYDVIMVSTAPPVLPGLAGRVASALTGAKLIYHCMDIHPEIGRISGEFANPHVFRILERVDAKTCRRAARVVVLSEDMADAIRSRDGCADVRIEVINNFALKPEDAGGATPPPLPPGRLRMLFAGNIGRFQGLECFVDAMHRLAENGHSGAQLIFMGEGAALPELKRRASGPGSDLIHFLPHQPVSVATAMMQRVELGLVSLVGGIYRYAYPSKTTTYIDNHCPMLVAVEKSSRLARDIEDAGLGVVVAPGDTDGLVACIEALLAEPSRIAAMKENVSAAARDMDKPRILARWSALARDISREST